MTEGKRHVRQIKGALLLIGILVLGSVSALFVIHQQKASSDQPGGDAVIRQKAAISLRGVHHTAIMNGIKEWSLDAESADYMLEDSEAVFSSLHITFFSEEGDTVLMSADSGIWHTESNDLDVTGHIVIKNKQYVLKTEKLQYIHERRVLTTLTPVTVTGEVSTATADKMIYNLDKDLFYLDGNVDGMIGKDIEL